MRLLSQPSGRIGGRGNGGFSEYNGPTAQKHTSPPILKRLSFRASCMPRINPIFTHEIHPGIAPSRRTPIKHYDENGHSPRCQLGHFHKSGQNPTTSARQSRTVSIRCATPHPPRFRLLLGAPVRGRAGRPQPKAPCGIGTSGCRHFGGDVRVDMGYRNGAMRHGGSCGAAKTSKITKSTGVRMGPGAGTSEAISIMP
jgi:hypothetical protein